MPDKEAELLAGCQRQEARAELPVPRQMNTEIGRFCPDQRFPERPMSAIGAPLSMLVSQTLEGLGGTVAPGSSLRIRGRCPKHAQPRPSGGRDRIP